MSSDQTAAAMPKAVDTPVASEASKEETKPMEDTLPKLIQKEAEAEPAKPDGDAEPADAAELGADMEDTPPAAEETKEPAAEESATSPEATKDDKASAEAPKASEPETPPAEEPSSSMDTSADEKPKLKRKASEISPPAEETPKENWAAAANGETNGEASPASEAELPVAAAAAAPEKDQDDMVAAKKAKKLNGATATKVIEGDNAEAAKAATEAMPKQAPVA